MKLISVNISGNIQQACEVINKCRLAEALVHIESPKGHNTIAVFRVPNDFDETTMWRGR